MSHEENNNFQGQIQKNLDLNEAIIIVKSFKKHDNVFHLFQIEAKIISENCVVTHQFFA